MARLGLEKDIVDKATYDRTLARFREARIRLPTFAELADPSKSAVSGLSEVDPDSPRPENLFRVHWYNSADRRSLVAVPEFVVLPEALTGVEAPIVVALGDRFPMIRAHKVLAAYACLVPRLITGQFDPTRHRAIWPSTGNYCRGGVAISRILGCRGVAVLPEEMSRERFAWLEEWVADPSDIIKTPGSESNVKEIYDKCAELDTDEKNIVFNQFCEFGNYLVHHDVTGPALDQVFGHLQSESDNLRLRAFVSATGSAGTIAAGDYLKERHGALIAAVEALECPTMLYNGFGAHNIQGIGDKHIPLIHNVINTDFVIGISDRSTDSLNVVFNTDAGRSYLMDRRRVAADLVDKLSAFGLSSICNVLAAIKLAKYWGWGRDDVIVTVATDGAEMYGTERSRTESDLLGSLDAVGAAEIYGEHILGAGVDHLQQLSEVDRARIFNLGYFTWVEQQGVTLEQFEARRHPSFWRSQRDLVGAWDEQISAFNRAALG